MPPQQGRIIILNGVSSSGKTTLARGLQARLDQPYFWIANDTFCDMVPEKYWEQDWVTSINQALTAMVYTIRTFSDLGLNTIVDQVFLRNETEGAILPKCVEVLSGCPVWFVRVDCEPAELERREQARGDRDIGQALAQLPLVHQHQLYDCVVDTSSGTLDQQIDEILAALNCPPDRGAFWQLKQRLDQAGSIYPGGSPAENQPTSHHGANQ